METMEISGKCWKLNLSARGNCVESWEVMFLPKLNTSTVALDVSHFQTYTSPILNNTAGPSFHVLYNGFIISKRSTRTIWFIISKCER